MARILRITVALAAAALALGFAGRAAAAGGHYVIQGGNAYEHKQVVAALNASSFDWNVIPQTITIDITPVATSEAIPGEIFLDPDLLDSGSFSWGVVQHEYAHQIDFLVLTAADRQLLAQSLGGSSWWATSLDQAHSDVTAERFASSVSWAYWQSSDNALSPGQCQNESGAMKPAAFRSLLTGILQQHIANAAKSAAPAPAPTH